MKLSIALDIDGAFSPITTMNSGPPEPEQRWGDWEYLVTSSRNFGACFASPLVQSFKRLHEMGVKMLWHSSWRSGAQDYLAPELELPHWEQLATEEEAQNFDDGWWKAVAVKRWLDESLPDEHLIWIDDDIARNTDEGRVPNEVLESPQVTLISPDRVKGLGPAELDLIEELANSGSKVVDPHS